MRRLSYLVSSQHPDYEAFREQSEQSRTLYNMVNSIARTLYFHNSKHDYGSGIYAIAEQFNYDAKNLKPGYSYMGLLSIAQHLIDEGFLPLHKLLARKQFSKQLNC